MFGLFVLMDAGLRLFWLNGVLYVCAVLVRRYVDVWVPDRFFRPSRLRFHVFRWERGGDFYRDVLKIDRWKDKLPCLNGRTNFAKKKLSGRRTEYLEQFITETCRSESDHVSLIGFVVVMRLWTPFDLWLLCFVLAVVGNVPFICIQRYNRPRLERTLVRIEQRRVGRGYQPRALDARPDAPVAVDEAWGHSFAS